MTLVAISYSPTSLAQDFNQVNREVLCKITEHTLKKVKYKDNQCSCLLPQLPYFYRLFALMRVLLLE